MQTDGSAARQRTVLRAPRASAFESDDNARQVEVGVIDNGDAPSTHMWG